MVALSDELLSNLILVIQPLQVMNYLEKHDVITTVHSAGKLTPEKVTDRIRKLCLSNKRTAATKELLSYIQADNVEYLYSACLHCGLRNAAQLLRPLLPTTYKEPRDITNIAFNKPGLNLTNTYPQTHWLNGLVIVFNNYEFRRKKRTRVGTNHDCVRIRSSFERHGFLVNQYNDYSAKKVVKKCKEIATNEIHRRCNGLIIFFLTHGTSGGKHSNMLLGSDNASYDVNDIIELFSNSKVLDGKPKCFFPQACRGDREDTGVHKHEHPVNVVSSSSSSSSSSQTFTWSSPAKRTRSSQEVVQETAVSMDTNGVPTESSPVRKQAENGTASCERPRVTFSEPLPNRVHDHVFIGYPSVDGFTSYRSPESGTWYVQAICDMVDRHGHEKHMQTLIDLVAGEVSQKTNKLRQRQNPECKDGLLSDYYLSPL